MAQRGYRWYFRKGLIEVDWETGCWLWLGAQFPDGYGKIRGPGGRTGLPMRAQRYFWELYRGPAGRLDVGHKCHRRLCVRVKHLKVVTHAVNMRDMFIDYEFGDTDKSTVIQMMTAGADSTLIAEALMAPRPVVWKLMRELNHTLSLGFDLE